MGVFDQRVRGSVSLTRLVNEVFITSACVRFWVECTASCCRPLTRRGVCSAPESNTCNANLVYNPCTPSTCPGQVQVRSLVLSVSRSLSRFNPEKHGTENNELSTLSFSFRGNSDVCRLATSLSHVHAVTG